MLWVQDKIESFIDSHRSDFVKMTYYPFAISKDLRQIRLSGLYDILSIHLSKFVLILIFKEMKLEILEIVKN